MDLFEQAEQRLQNRLPYDGEVYYYGKIFSAQDSEIFLKALLDDIAWQHDEAVIYGKHIQTQRQVAWYADKAFPYHYSNTTRIAKPWVAPLPILKQSVEAACSESFNACLLNLYQHGNQGMAWHSDAEKELKPGAPIASLSFGAQRKFSFKHKITKEKCDVILEPGSLLIMRGVTQNHWLHSLPKTRQSNMPRVNLTFRTMLES